MITDLIDEIREDVDTLYNEHNLLVKVIQVSQSVYIEIQRYVMDLMISKNLSNYIPKEPIEIDGIPVVINADYGNYDYELVVSIPSYRFRKDIK